jgi:hypothetical protein
MRHRLQNAALPKTRLVGQLHRIEHGPRRHTDRADLRHGLVFGALPCPTGNDFVDLGLVLQAGGRVSADLEKRKNSISKRELEVLQERVKTLGAELQKWTELKEATETSYG